MSIIPNLNIVIQGGDAARETHQIRNQPLEAAQGILLKRDDSDEIKRTVTQPLEEPDRVMLEKDKHHSRSKNEKREDRRRKTEKPSEEPLAEFGDSGTLLNTVA